MREDFLCFVSLSGASIGLPEISEPLWIVVQLHGFLIFGDGIGALAFKLEGLAQIVMREIKTRIHLYSLAQLRNRFVVATRIKVNISAEISRAGSSLINKNTR